MNDGPIENLFQAIASETTSTTPKKFWWGDAISILLIVFSLVVGSRFWISWFQSSDRILFALFVSVGIFVRVFYTHWQGDESRKRIPFSILFWAVSSLCLIVSLLTQNEILSVLAVSFALMAWFFGRALGEPQLYGLLFAFAFASPAFIQFLETTLDEPFSQLTLLMTSRLSDVGGLVFAFEGDSLVFELGTSREFSPFRTWDGITTLIGVAFAFSLAMRRNDFHAILSIPFSMATWLVTRCISLFALYCLSSWYLVWYEWTISIQLTVFVLNCGLVFLTDQFLQTLLSPIPLENDMEAPALAFLWNWIGGLPKLTHPIPTGSKSYAIWIQSLFLEQKESTKTTDARWLGREFLLLLVNPASTFGAITDATRGWCYSRNWKVLLFTFLTLALPTLLVVISTFFIGSHTQSSQRITDVSFSLCSTEDLERYTVEHQENDFCKAIGIPPTTETAADRALLPDRKLQFLEALTRRIVDANPGNQELSYRLGMIYSLRDNDEKANELMSVLASGKLGVSPAANGWLAKELIKRRATGEEIALKEILFNIDKGRLWKGIDYRLLVGMATLFAEQGKSDEAIELMKQAVSIKPELILELARFCQKMGRADFEKTANEAENFFLQRIGFASEQEEDRIAVAEARVLLNRLLPAEQVLQEGLTLPIAGKRLRRQLSEVQYRIYLTSIKKLEDGTYEANIDLLEKAVVTDPENPIFSSAIANLLSYKLRPTKQLLETLKLQIQTGLTPVPAHLTLAEGYYAMGKQQLAVEHWELALKSDPNSIVGLNNLSLCLANMTPPNLERAIELATRAHLLAPENPSVLDTLGEVLLLSNRPKEAINKLELSIRYDHSRIVTRKKLVQAYEAAGMEEMAKAQSSVIELIEQKNPKTK